MIAGDRYNSHFICLVDGAEVFLSLDFHLDTPKSPRLGRGMHLSQLIQSSLHLMYLTIGIDVKPVLGVFQNFISEAVSDGFFGFHPVIAVGVFFDLREFFAGVFGENFMQELFDAD